MLCCFIRCLRDSKGINITPDGPKNTIQAAIFVLTAEPVLWLVSVILCTTNSRIKHRHRTKWDQRQHRCIAELLQTVGLTHKAHWGVWWGGWGDQTVNMLLYIFMFYVGSVYCRINIPKLLLWNACSCSAVSGWHLDSGLHAPIGWRGKLCYFVV